MSGQFRVNQVGDPLLPNTRALFLLDDGAELRFVDQRMFGGLDWRPGEGACPVGHVALDPFDPAFDAAAVGRRLRTRRTAVKRALLDQRLVSGIGNIYADETLWRAKTHFETPGDEIGPRQAVALIRTAADVMAEALAQGGTSFDALYVHVNGESGYFDRSLERLRPRGRAVRALRHGHRAAAVHEPQLRSCARAASASRGAWPGDRAV